MATFMAASNSGSKLKFIDKKKHVPVALPYPYRLPANRTLRPVNKQLDAVTIGLIIGQFE
ncbi:hypothetical protein L1D19_24680 [Vibrio natriegens]|uniref:hypothetical protein n=1 Tax=Vibrio natriegens TaxID=691 RepID=UPI001EFD3C8D|nr:hypothetical protein [Vibrio natriegens]MCG9703260.1 hypothetical protein [Vibrio natriegens]